MFNNHRKRKRTMFKIKTTAGKIFVLVLVVFIFGCGKETKKNIVSNDKDSRKPEKLQQKVTQHKQVKKVTQRGDNSLPLKQADLEGLYLGMSFDECIKVAIKNYGKNRLWGHKKNQRDVWVKDGTYNSTLPKEGINLQFVYAGELSTTGVVCFFSETSKGKIVSAIYKRMEIKDGILESVMEKQLLDKYGKYDLKEDGKLFWLLKGKRYGRKGMERMKRMFISVSPSSFRGRADDVIKTHNIKNIAWLNYRFVRENKIVKSLEIYLVDVPTILEGQRIKEKKEKERKRKEKEKREKAILKKAMQPKKITL